MPKKPPTPQPGEVPPTREPVEPKIAPPPDRPVRQPQEPPTYPPDSPEHDAPVEEPTHPQTGRPGIGYGSGIVGSFGSIVG